MHGSARRGGRAQHREGWDRYLDRLAVASLGGDPGPDELDEDG